MGLGGERTSNRRFVVLLEKSSEWKPFPRTRDRVYRYRESWFEGTGPAIETAATWKVGRCGALASERFEIAQRVCPRLHHAEKQRIRLSHAYRGKYRCRRKTSDRVQKCCSEK